MSDCILDEGYDLGCFGTGGVKKVYISNFSSSLEYTEAGTDGEIDSVTAPGTFFEFEQDIETALFNESINPSRENGTVFYESTVAIKLFNNTAKSRNLIKSLASAPLTILIEDNNGGYWAMGLDTAVRASEGERGFGQAFGDMNGATITFTHKSAEPVKAVDATIFAGLIPA